MEYSYDPSKIIKSLSYAQHVFAPLIISHIRQSLIVSQSIIVG